MQHKYIKLQTIFKTLIGSICNSFYEFCLYPCSTESVAAKLISVTSGVPHGYKSGQHGGRPSVFSTLWFSTSVTINDLFGGAKFLLINISIEKKIHLNVVESFLERIPVEKVIKMFLATVSFSW